MKISKTICNEVFAGYPYLIWFMNGDERLSKKALDIIRNERNICVVSIASIWEIAIKINIGKLGMKVDFKDISQFLEKNNVTVLPIDFSHLSQLLSLEIKHRDPFDRLIISQAITENISIVTTDKFIKDYPVKCLW